MDDDVSTYIDGIDPRYRTLFDRIHDLIVGVFPDVSITLSYDMPTYKVGKKKLFVATWKHGISMYGWGAGEDGGFVERHPELRYSATHVGGSGAPAADKGNRFAFFDCLIEPETRVYLSEDYVFCRRWQAMGGDVWADLHSRLTHVGTHAFSGDYAVRLGLANG